MAAGRRRSRSASSALARDDVGDGPGGGEGIHGGGRYARRSAGPRTAGVASSTMSDGWNFADLFEALAERQPEAMAQRHAGVTTTWAEFDRRADGVAADAARRRRRRAGQGRPVPLQRAGVPRVGVRRVQGRAGDRSTRTTATPPTSSSTCGTTPTSSPSSSTARSPSASTSCRHRAAAHPHVAVGRRRPRAVPGLGDRRTRTPRRRRPAATSPGRGAAPATTSCCSTPAARPAAEGRDVAPGRPVRRPRLGQPQAPAARARTSTRPPTGSPSRARATCRPRR